MATALLIGIGLVILGLLARRRPPPARVSEAWLADYHGRRHQGNGGN